MPGSAALEKIALEYILEKKVPTATKTYLGMSSLKVEAGKLTKATTGKEFGEKEPKEAEGWARVEIDTITWTKTESLLISGFTVWENEAAISMKVATGAEEVTLNSFAILDKPLQTEVGNVLAFANLTTPVLWNKSLSTFKVEAKALKVECE